MPRVSHTTEVENVENITTRRRAAPKKTSATKIATKKTATKTTAKSDSKKPTRKAPVKRAATAKKKTVQPDQATSDTNEVLLVDGETELQTIAASTGGKKRKAPTVFADEVAKKRASKTQAIVIGLLIIIGVGASAAVGITDSQAGQINVAQTIKERNERMANMVDVDGPVIVAPVTERDTRPDGGFIAAAQQPAPNSARAAVASGTASSTEALASTTLDGVESNEESSQDPANLNASIMDTATTTVTAVNRADTATESEPSNQTDSTPE